jgi:hypothetical protein
LDDSTHHGAQTAATSGAKVAVASLMTMSGVAPGSDIKSCHGEARMPSPIMAANDAAAAKRRSEVEGLWLFAQRQ